MLSVPLYIIILVVALPQLSETIYIPSLPDLARDLSISYNQAEYTLTIYLSGFAIGVLIWGNISDYHGRKPCLLSGFLIYILACIACYFSSTIDFLLVSRFFQAFGASVGSVVGQAIARDAIQPENRGKLFSTVSIAMAFAPAVGPIIGGSISQLFHWSSVFIALIFIASILIWLISTQLSETNPNLHVNKNVLLLYKKCFSKMIADRRVMGFSFLIGAVNGILFGYFAESPFYFIENFGLSSSVFGLLSFFICVPLAIGGFISRRLHAKKFTSDQIIHYGAYFMCAGSSMFFISVWFGFIQMEQLQQIAIIQTLLWVSLVVAGISMIIPNCLSQALEPYGEFAGTAASLFGFSYYLLVSLFTALMGHMHDGSLLSMPLFMLIVSLSTLIVFKTMVIRKGNSK